MVDKTPVSESADDFLKRIKSKSSVITTDTTAPASDTTTPAPSADTPTPTPVVAAPSTQTVAAPEAPKTESSDDYLKRIKANAGIKETAPDEGMSWNRALRDWKSEAYQAGQGALEAGAGIAGLPTLAANVLGYLPNKLLGLDRPAIQYGSAGNILNTLSNHGLYDDKSQPKSFPEQVSRTAGGAIPGAVLGMGADSLLGKGVNALSNAAYSFIPGLVSDYAQKIGIPPLLTAPIAALSMTGSERLLAENAAKSAAAKAAEQAAADKSAFVKAGPGFTLEQQNAAAATKTQAGVNREFSEADAIKRHEDDLKTSDEHVRNEHAGADADREAVASSLGQATTEEEGTAALQSKARQWLGTEFKPKLAEAEKGMYYKPDGTPLIPEDSPGDTTHLKDSIVNSFTSGGEAEPVTSLFRSSLPDKVNSKLDMLAKQQGKPEGTAPEFTFDDLRSIRSAIGDALGTPSIVSSIGVKKLNEMYRGINDDIRATISKSAGQEGLDQFDKFNKEATRLFGVAGTVSDNIVSSVNAGKETITPRMVADNNMWRDSTLINQLRSEKTLSEGVDEVAASRLRTGKNTPGLDPMDAEQHFKDLPVPAKTALFGDEKAGQIQDSIDRKAAAETTATEMKKQADIDLTNRKGTAATIEQQQKDALKATQRVERKERAEQGIDIREKAKTTAEQQKMATDPAQRLIDFGNKLKWHLGGAAPAIYSGYHALTPEFAHMAQNTGIPDWIVSGLGYPALGLTGALAAGGAREIIHNPAAIKNITQGTAPIAPFTSPNALGFGVNYGEEKK